MLEFLPALLSVYVTSKRNDETFEEVLDGLSCGMLNPDEFKRIIQFEKMFNGIMQKMWDELESNMCPNLPIDEFVGIRSRVINIADWNKTDFDYSSSDFDKYMPQLKKFHSRLLLTFVFGNEEKEHTCFINVSDLDLLIKRLNIAKKQLEHVLREN